MAQLKIIFRLEAYADIDQAFYFYAQWAEGRIAAKFMRTLDDALERISIFPQSYLADPHGVRRFLLRRFPFWVYYRLHTDAIEVLAVQHTKRDTYPIDWNS